MCLGATVRGSLWRSREIGHLGLFPSPNKVIASLELLATLIGVKLWVPDSKDRQVSKLAIRGYTDNQSNEALVKSSRLKLELHEFLGAQLPGRR